MPFYFSNITRPTLSLLLLFYIIAKIMTIMITTIMIIAIMIMKSNLGVATRLCLLSLTLLSCLNMLGTRRTATLVL